MELQLGTMTPGVRAAFAGLPTGSQVLDVACGIGLDAFALSRSGHHVTATDGSPSMVEATRRRFERGNVEGSVAHSTWSELPVRLPPGTFEVVVCTGNSIAHCRDRGDMVESLRAMAEMLVPGGLLIADTHHWEPLAERGDTVVTDPTPIERDGSTCRRSFRWTWATRPWTVTIEIELDIERGGHRFTRTYSVKQVPFTVHQLRDRIRAAGLEVVGLDPRPSDDRYAIVGRAPATG